MIAINRECENHLWVVGPPRYRKVGDFPRVVAGEVTLGSPLYFIAGNHDPYPMWSGSTVLSCAPRLRLRAARIRWPNPFTFRSLAACATTVSRLGGSGGGNIPTSITVRAFSFYLHCCRHGSRCSLRTQIPAGSVCCWEDHRGPVSSPPVRLGEYHATMCLPRRVTITRRTFP